ncbi:MAG: type II secretion system protein GspD [Planctomycetota bacterium]|jgi:type II secretory pathway component GspD/PulD (secretin)
MRNTSGTLLFLFLFLSASGPSRAAEQKEVVLPQNVTTEVKKQEKEEGGEDPSKDLTKVNGDPICRVEVTKYNTVSVHAQNVRMSTVLQTLAVKSHRNIVLASGADRVVSMTFYSVPFKDALETMLDVNGLAYREENNFISVFTRKELTNRVQGAGGITSEIFRLNYLRPKEAVSAIKGLLSKEGSTEVLQDDPPSDKDADMSMEGTKKSDPVYKPESQRFALRSALVVHDYKENLKSITALLKKLDKRPPQVLLEATVLEVTLNETNALGVDFAILQDTSFLEFFNFSNKFSPFSDVLRDGAQKILYDDNGVPIRYNTNTVGERKVRPFAATEMGNVGSGAASIRGGVSYGNFAVFIRALSQYTNVSVLSNPKVLSLDRQRARVMMGQNVGYIESNFQDGQMVQTTKFIETGIVLDVRPYILENGMVRMVLAPKVSKVDFRNQQIQAGVTQQIPDETIKTVAADIVVPEGATAVIGGLFQEQTQKNAQQIPFLGDVPGIGALARGQDDTVVRKELIFMIRATVLNDNELADMGNQGKNDAQQMLSGGRKGLLPWSKLWQSANLSLKATRAFNTGHKDLAAWMARRALQLNSQQPDVIRQLADAVEPDDAFAMEGALFDLLHKRFGRSPGEREATPPPAKPTTPKAEIKTSSEQTPAPAKSVPALSAAADPAPRAAVLLGGKKATPAKISTKDIKEQIRAQTTSIVLDLESTALKDEPNREKGSAPAPARMAQRLKFE